MESLEFGGFIWILWVTLTPRNIKLNELKKKPKNSKKLYPHELLKNDNENWPNDSSCCANKQNDSTIYDTLCISGFSFYF